MKQQYCQCTNTAPYCAQVRHQVTVTKIWVVLVLVVLEAEVVAQTLVDVVEEHQNEEAVVVVQEEGMKTRWHQKRRQRRSIAIPTYQLHRHRHQDQQLA